MSRQGPKTKADPARLLALKVGSAVRIRNAFTQELIASIIDPSGLPTQDRAFATRLSLGVTSCLGTLDELIDRFLKNPSDIKADVRDALRISTYEIFFLDKSPHAAVFQGAELVKTITPKATGLANFVLRRMVEAKDAFPFGDPATDRAALARNYAFPVWMTEMLIADLGREAAIAFMKASNEPAPIFLAANSLKITDAAVETLFKEAKIEVETVSFPDFPLEGCYRLQEPRSLQTKTIRELFGQGKLLVSDAASQAVANIAVPNALPVSYLEIGSGRGTKTILLQSNAKRRFGRQLPLNILDNHEFKNKLTLKRAAAYGASIEESFVHDATDLSFLGSEKHFDAIFLDAPCSGLGTLRRHPEIRWRLKPQDIQSLALLGASMLKQAASYLTKGGQLVYATCSITKAENLNVIESFLRSQQGSEFTLKPIAAKDFFAPALIPGSSDAHFAVRLARKS